MLLNEKAQKRNTVITICVTAVFFVATWIMFVYLDGLKFECRDLQGHRAIVGYTMKGLDPYKLIGVEAIDEFVGTIPPRFSTVPWALVFGAFFYPGYMPITAAKVYLTALHIVFLALGIYLIYKRNHEKKNLFVIAFAAVSHFSFMYSIFFGNCGGVISLMIICALLLVDEKPVIAGLIMGIALLKPQISALFCLVWLIDKKIKPLIIAGAFCVAGWAASSALTGINPLQLLKEMSEASTASEEQYLGLLSPLRFLGVDSMIILGLNVIIGVAFMVILGIKLKKSGANKFSPFLKYTPAAIASCFWIYKNGTDFLILLIAVIALIEILPYCGSFKEYLPVIFCIGCFEMSRAVISVLSKLFMSHIVFRDLIKSGEGLLLMILGIITCRMVTAFYKEKSQVKE